VAGVNIKFMASPALKVRIAIRCAPGYIEFREWIPVMGTDLTARTVRWLVLLCLTAAGGSLCAQSPAEPLKLAGYVEVTSPQIRLSVPDADVAFRAGDNIPLFQENADYFVGIISGEAPFRRLVAVRRPIWADPPVWVTKEGRMVFGSAASSSRGHVEFEAGKKLGVAAVEGKAYQVLLKSGEHLIRLDVPVNKRGLGELVAVRSEWRRKPAQRVIAMTSKTNVPDVTARASASTGAPPESAAEPVPDDAPGEDVSKLSRMLQMAREHMDRPDSTNAPSAPEADKEDTVEETGDAERTWALPQWWPYALSLFFAVALLPLYRRYRRQRAQAPPRPPKPKKEKKPSRKKKISREKKKTVKVSPAPPEDVEPAPAPAQDVTETLPLAKRSAQEIPVVEAKSAEPSAEGFMIGRYQAKSVQGRGTTGIVYKAWQEDLKRTVALKVLKEGRHASMEAKLRFLREAQALARLRHPNIITVYEVGEIDGQPFFSMDFVDGTSLDKLIMTSRPGLRDSVELCRRIAETVHYAHENGIIHRDLKPGNIIVDYRGEPVITDFGLARNLDSGVLSMSGDIIGTPSYMSPEQAQGKTAEVDVRTDVYSIGAVLYSLLTGKSPFARASLLETLNAVINEAPESIRRLNAQVDRELAGICMKAMAKNKAQRYATAEKLADALARYLAVPPLQRRWRQVHQSLRAVFRKKPVPENP